MKLNELKQSKKAQIDEVDTSSLFGNYGSAALRTGAKSLFGKSTLSTQDQIAKDQFVKSFASKAATGLEDAIESGWVATGGVNQPAAPTINTQPAAQPGAQQGQEPVSGADNAIAQKRIAAQKAQAAAIREPGSSEGPKYAIDPNKQMAPFSKLPAKAPATPKTPEQIRQEKLAAASQAAQGQMSPVSKLPSDQFAKTAANVRQQQQGVATQNAQGQMSPVSKLPTNQFAKTASNVRQTQQAQAATTAQGQMTPKVASPTPKTPEQIRQAKQAAAQAGIDRQFNQNKPDNTVRMPKRNKNPKSKVAESQFDKLNYIFENILAEAETEEVAKKSISQWIIDFFKKFMKGEDITSDPTIMQNVIALAKELEQNYAKDKGKTTIPKLASLAWSATHAPGEKATAEQPAEPEKPEVIVKSQPIAPSQVAPANNAGNDKAKTAYKQIQDLLKGLTTANKQKILASLQKELATTTQKEPTISMSGKKQNPNDPAVAQLLATAKKQGKI